jgi:hypothetical protein
MSLLPLAHAHFYTSGGLAVVLVIVLLFLFWPAPAGGPRQSPVGLLWVVLVIIVVLLLLGLL